MMVVVVEKVMVMMVVMVIVVIGTEAAFCRAFPHADHYNSLT